MTPPNRAGWAVTVEASWCFSIDRARLGFRFAFQTEFKQEKTVHNILGEYVLMVLALCRREVVREILVGLIESLLQTSPHKELRELATRICSRRASVIV